MKSFLIQTINNRVEHDFSFHLIKAIEYNNWFYNEKVYDYILSDNINDYKNYYKQCTPVGSLEFVFKHIEYHHNIDRKIIQPINIPKELLVEEFLKRKVFIANKNDISFSEEKFVKSNTQYKSFMDIVSNADKIPDGDYLVSDVIEIESEWRAFVFRNELVGLKQYIGDFKLFPDVSFIEKMIHSYTQSPTAYTLDIGINSAGCFVIEVHPFVSCGLYGFQDYKRLPLMLLEGYRYLIKG